MRGGLMWRGVAIRPLLGYSAGAGILERLEEARRWLMQALRDLKAATDSLEDGNYEWACFQAQQAAEKAVKALLYGYGMSGWGHSIVELLDALKGSIEVSEDLYTAARELDRHYIPSRYPNAFASGYPGLYYDRPTAEKAIEASRRIIDWVKARLAAIGLRV